MGHYFLDRQYIHKRGPAEYVEDVEDIEKKLKKIKIFINKPRHSPGGIIDSEKACATIFLVSRFIL